MINKSKGPAPKKNANKGPVVPGETETVKKCEWALLVLVAVANVASVHQSLWVAGWPESHLQRSTVRAV